MIKTSEQEQSKVRVPNEKKKEIFAVVQKILGGSRMDVHCQDGKSRMARIPGGKRRALKRIRTGDVLIVSPWDIQDEKADIVYKYRKTQANLLKKKKILPEELIID